MPGHRSRRDQEKSPSAEQKGLSHFNASPGDRASNLGLPSAVVPGRPIDHDGPTDGHNSAAAVAGASGWGGNRPTGSCGNHGRKPNRLFRR